MMGGRFLGISVGVKAAVAVTEPSFSAFMMEPLSVAAKMEKLSRSGLVR